MTEAPQPIRAIRAHSAIAEGIELTAEEVDQVVMFMLDQEREINALKEERERLKAGGSVPPPITTAPPEVTTPVTRIKIHWSIRATESYAHDFEIEELDPPLRSQILATMAQVVREDGEENLTGSVIDFNYGSEDGPEVEDLLPGLEETGSLTSSQVDDRYITGFEVLRG